MKPVSTFVIALALATGACGLSTSVTFAKDAPKAAPTVAPVLSAPFRKAAADVQTALKAGNTADTLAKIAVLDGLATQPDEKYFTAVMRFELSKATKDRVLMRRGINDMIASGSKVMTNIADLQYNAGALAYEANDYADAAAKLADADRSGSKETNRLLLGAESNFKLNQPAAGLALLERGIAEYKASGQTPPVDWYRRAISVSLKAKSPSDVTKWSQLLVKGFPTPENWRDALILFRDSARQDTMVQLDIYRLMRQTASLKGERDFYEYAEVANGKALPGESKSVIEEAFAGNATLKSSRALGELLALANGKIAADRASVSSDDKRGRATADGKIAANTGNAYLAYGEYAKAIELLKLSLSKGNVDKDQVNTRLGIALLKLGQKAEARQAFQSVGGTRADLAKFWLTYLDLNP